MLHVHSVLYYNEANVLDITCLTIEKDSMLSDKDTKLRQQTVQNI